MIDKICVTEEALRTALKSINDFQSSVKKATEECKSSMEYLLSNMDDNLKRDVQYAIERIGNISNAVDKFVAANEVPLRARIAAVENYSSLK